MNLTKAQRLLFSSSLSVFLAGCGAPNYSQSEMHMTVEEADSSRQVKPENIPALVKASPTAPVLSAREDSSTFDVVVTNVPVRDLLFALARDAGVNMDVDDSVGGFVSVSALDQTLDAILARIGEQVAIRVEHVGDAIIVKADTPYHKYYQVDFLNVARTYTSDASSAGVGDVGNASISNVSENDFWGGLEESIVQILSVGAVGGEVSSAVAAKEIAGEEGGEEIGASEIKFLGENTYNLNSETGVLLVYAPDSLQKQIQELLDRTVSSAKRQVLLEATIVEVILNNQYAQGIDWSLFNSLAEEGLALYQGGAVGGAASALEYVIREVEREFAEIEFDAAAYTDLSTGNIRTLYGDQLSATQIAEVNAAYGVSNIVGANVLALALRDNYVNRIRSDAYGDPYRSVTEFETTQDSERDEDTGLFTYTGGVTYSAEELNEEATAKSSGGLQPNNLLGDSYFTAAYRQGDISAAVQLLDRFGDAKVLSSPRISVLNHQPALLRVVDQEVYFNFEIEEEVSESGQATSRSYTAEENTVDVGFVMNVLPHISEDGEIILNLKPAVTRIIDYRSAPVLETFNSGSGGTQNVVPITRVRELESIISLRDGEIAVLGGLLEDRTTDDNNSVPGLSNLPGVGALFEKKNESTYKTEFVVFIRARIISNPSINGDYSDYRHLLPNSDFIIRDTESTIVPPAQLKAR